MEFDKDECYRYIVDRLGKEERLPARHNIKTGTDEMLTRLKFRYGPSYTGDFTSLIAKHLSKQEGSSPEDKALWRAWRADYAVTRGFSTPGCHGAMTSRVVCWNSTESFDPRSVSSSRRVSSGPLFLAEDEGKGIEWETRVDQANSSKPATGLLAEPKGTERGIKKMLAPSHLKPGHSKAQTPWEEQEFWEGGVVYHAVEKGIANFKEKLKGRDPSAHGR